MNNLTREELAKVLRQTADNVSGRSHSMDNYSRMVADAIRDLIGASLLDAARQLANLEKEMADSLDFVTHEELTEALLRSSASGQIAVIPDVVKSLGMSIHDGRLCDSHGDLVAFRQAANQGGTIKTNYVVIHYTAGGSGKSTVRFFEQARSKASAHLVIDRDGQITQMVSFDRKAWHAGHSTWDALTGLNQYSIGIELANWGWLNDHDGWRSHAGVVVPDSKVLVSKHRNGGKIKGWEIYPEEQLESAALAVRAICDRYNILVDNILGHDDIAPDRKVDPGPAFDMAGFRDRVESLQK